MNNDELKKILKEHEKWLETNGKEGSRADLSWVDLSETDLRGANLFRVNLIEANLSGANLSGADLSEADLRGTDLFGTDLSEANLSGANLFGADLSEGDLSGADLSGADLSEGDLSGADLSGADLSEADLSGASLSEANLRGAKNVPEYLQDTLRVCPKEGKFIGWKKCGGTIIKLEIPEDAKRSNATTRKCRCSKAKVLSIEDLNGYILEINGDILEIKGYAHYAYHHTTVYKVGEMVYPDSFDEDWKNECSHGIHFFMTRKEAVEY